MLQYSLEVGICWAILYLIYIAFLRRETFFSINRYYLLSSLVLGMLIPVLRTIPIAFQEEAVVVNEALYFISAGPQLIAANIAPPAETESILTLNNLLLLVYGLGVLFVGSRLAIGLLKIKNLYVSGQRTNKGSFTLVETERFHLPFSFLNCVFFSKEMPINGNIEKILKHELTHVESWHTLDVLFTEVLQVIFWFNPLIILYKRAIKESHEYVADASVLQDTSQKIYGQILLRQSQSGLQIALANHFFHSHIKKRLTMMKQKKSKRPAMIKYLFALPVILLLMVLFQSQALPEDKTLIDPNFPQEFQDAINSENAYYEVKELQEKKISEFLLKELREDFEALYHNTDHDKNIKVTVSKFEDLLNLYVGKYPAKKDFIKRSFKSIGQSMGMKIGFKQNSLDFDHLMFVVPDEKLSEYQSGMLPEYEQMVKNDEMWDVPDLTNASDYYILVDGKEVKENVFREKKFEAIAVTFYSPETARKEIGKSGKEGAIVIEGIKWGEAKQIPNNNLEIIKAESFTVYNDNGSSAPPSPPVFDMPDLPPNPPSLDVVWKQIAANDEMEVIIDGKSVTTEKAISLRNSLRLFTVSMDDEDNSKITFVEFETSTNKYASQQIYKAVDQYPRFPGCEKMEGSDKEKSDCSKNKMLQFIYTNLRYPVEARKAGIQGSNVIKFVVEPDGSVTAGKVVRDIGGGTKEAVQDVVQKMADMDAKWTPGLKNGEAVRVMFHLPVRFRLEGEKPVDMVYEYEGQEVETSNNVHLEVVAHKAENEAGEEVFKVVEQMPYFPGCEDLDGGYEDKLDCGKKKMLEFIYTNLKYPEEARVNGVQGNNVVQFVVEKDGKLSEMTLVRDIGGGTGEETMKVMKRMQKEYTWTPGYQNGKAVKVLFTLPVRFKLDNADTECCDNEDLKKDSDDSKKASILFRHDSDSEPPLFVVDGIKKGKQFNVNTDLENFEVLSLTAVNKEDAILRYGDDGMHGAVEVITKQNVKPGEIFTVVEEMPRFPGCEDFRATKEAREQCAKKELLQFVYRRLNYPQEAREGGIDGTAVVQFVIDKTGHVINPKVVRDVEGVFEEPVLEVINAMISQEKIWTPGKHNGEPVNVLFTLPVKFILEQLDVDSENQPSQEVKKVELEDPNNIETWITGLAPSKVLNVISTSTLSDVSFDYYTDKAGPVNVSLFNTLGQLLKTEALNVLEGKNTSTIGLDANISGLYVVTVTQGQSRISRKIFLK